MMSLAMRLLDGRIIEQRIRRLLPRSQTDQSLCIQPEHALHHFDHLAGNSAIDALLARVVAFSLVVGTPLSPRSSSTAPRPQSRSGA